MRSNSTADVRQLHKAAVDVVIFTRNGYDYTARFPVIRDSLLSLPVRSAISDAELVVCDSGGKRDFKAHCSSAATLGRPGCWLIRERSGRATRSDVVMH